MKGRPPAAALLRPDRIPVVLVLALGEGDEVGVDVAKDDVAAAAGLLAVVVEAIVPHGWPGDVRDIGAIRREDRTTGRTGWHGL